MARTNIELDDDLVERAMDFTGARSKREVVDIAPRRLVDKGSLYRSIRKLRASSSGRVTSTGSACLGLVEGMRETVHDQKRVNQPRG